MTFGYDPEAIYQDADIEMLEMADDGDLMCKTCDGEGHINEGNGVFHRCLVCDGEGQR